MATLNVIRRWVPRDQLSIREIARRTALARKTVKKYLQLDPTEPRYAKRLRSNKFDPYAKSWPVGMKWRSRERENRSALCGRSTQRSVLERKGEARMIELRHLRYFIAFAEDLRFRQAVDRTQIDQMPLSRTIRDLGDQLSGKLFARLPRRLHLTPAGIRVLREARKVLIRIGRMHRSVRETDARFRAPLCIGLAEGIAQPKLTECLITRRKVASEIQLELTEMRAAELAARLQRKELVASPTHTWATNEYGLGAESGTFPARSLTSQKAT